MWFKAMSPPLAFDRRLKAERTIDATQKGSRLQKDKLTIQSLRNQRVIKHPNETEDKSDYYH